MSISNDPIGETEQFFELNVNLAGASIGRNGVARAGQRRGLINAKGQVGLTLDVGLEYTTFGGKSLYFLYAGFSAGANASFTFQPNLNFHESGRASAVYRPAVGTIYDASVNPDDYKGQFVAISGGFMLKVTFPNPLTGKGGGKTFGQVTAIAFSPTAKEDGTYTHTQTFFGGGIPLGNVNDFSASITVKGGIGWSYYVPLFESETPPPQPPTFTDFVGYVRRFF